MEQIKNIKQTPLDCKAFSPTDYLLLLAFFRGEFRIKARWFGEIVQIFDDVEESSVYKRSEYRTLVPTGYNVAMPLLSIYNTLYKAIQRCRSRANVGETVSIQERFASLNQSSVRYTFFYSKFMARLKESAINGQSYIPLIKRSVDSVSSKLNPSLVSLDTNQQEAD